MEQLTTKDLFELAQKGVEVWIDDTDENVSICTLIFPNGEEVKGVGIKNKQ